MDFNLSCTVSGKLFDLYILGTATGCTLSARKQLFLKCSCTAAAVFLTFDYDQQFLKHFI